MVAAVIDEGDLTGPARYFLTVESRSNDATSHAVRIFNRNAVSG